MEFRPYFTWSKGHILGRVEAILYMKSRPYTWSQGHILRGVKAIFYVESRPYFTWSRGHMQQTPSSPSSPSLLQARMKPGKCWWNFYVIHLIFCVIQWYIWISMLYICVVTLIALTLHLASCASSRPQESTSLYSWNTLHPYFCSNFCFSILSSSLKDDILSLSLK